ncbi:TMEM165/GDT1 family protein [Phormidesmis sp. 146-33]
MALTELSIAQLAESDLDADQVIATAVVVPQPDLSQASKWSFWSVFGSTFVTIFLAELGDKTQIATLLMSAESHAPWVVFAGSATALIATSLIGVLIGRWLCTRLSPKTLEKATGTLLLFISLLLLLDVIQP